MKELKEIGGGIRAGERDQSLHVRQSKESSKIMEWVEKGEKEKRERVVSLINTIHAIPRSFLCTQLMYKHYLLLSFMK